ncbi:MAG: RuBisCO large subunit C-terminal-like domain-containing protein [candidate division Zixibacteria bacterium]|nr:RuBisCO large subunit C-terminal-like domain-containing protein [candidate division Zixibacteria bacterium]
MISPDIQKTHVVAKYRIKFKNGTHRAFHEGVRELFDITVFGGSRPFKYAPCDRNRFDLLYEFKLLDEDRNEGIVEVAWPPMLCTDKSGIPMVLSTCLFVSVYDFIVDFELYDLILPESMVSQYRGPRYGIRGLRQRLGVPQRPLLGLILKPRCDLTPAICANLAEAATRAGVDYVIDDELVVDPDSCRFEERAIAVMEAIDKASTHTKSSTTRTHYFMNVTSRGSRFRELYSVAERRGARGVGLNPVAMGFDAIDSLRRKRGSQLAIIANTIGRGVITEGSFRISPQILCLLGRICGADAVYTVPFQGLLRSKAEDLRTLSRVLYEPIRGIETAFGICSGGIDINNVLSTLHLHGPDVMIQVGDALCRQYDENGDISDWVKAFQVISQEYFEVKTIKKANASLLNKATHDKQLDRLLEKVSWHGDS